MSLTNIVYTPVDTGTAKISFNVESAKARVFYLLAGNSSNVVETGRPVSTTKKSNQFF